MTLLPFPGHRPRHGGFSLPELMIAIVIAGILATITVGGLLVNTRVWGLRSAARELAGYLEEAQAIAAGSTDLCQLRITGSGNAMQIGPHNPANNSCAAMAPARLLPSSPIPLDLSTPQINSNIFIRPRGLIDGDQPTTISLSASNTGGRSFCVQLVPPSALVAIGVIQGTSCNHAAFS